MKKVLFVLLLIVLMVSCTSMLPNNTKSEEVSKEVSEEVSKEVSKKNKDEYVTPYEYMAGITPIGDNGVWLVKNYVDEFGNPTDNIFIATTSIGAFSNSATNGSELLAGIIVNRNDVEINLLEYGSHPISVVGSSASIKVKMSVNGETIDVGEATFNKYTKRLTINNALPIFKTLAENSKVRMLITIDDYSLSKYLFDIDSAGFEYTYHEAFVK